MTLSPNTDGDLLVFSREDLAAADLDPDALTRDGLVALARRSLAAQSRPIPPSMEIAVYHSAQGILCFVLPRIPKGPSNCHFSVTFS